MRGVVRGVTRCGASACVGVPTTSVPILEADGEHALYCTNDCVTQLDENKNKLKLC
jgi:hypothetical protein